MTLVEDTILENRYRVDSVLAHGGMGVIYRGFDTKLKTEIAIKENYFRNSDSIHQFEQEALLLARLRHTNLPYVMDHFTNDERQYLVMSFIEGQDLWELIKQRGQPLNEREAIGFILQVCDAVSYLHNHDPSIIHRDIKPQNIKITPNGQAVLVDFGIAKVDTKNMLTSTAARGVTPGFSPPEQYSGSGTTTTADIYALGATLYAMLTGSHPPDSIKLITGEATFEFPNDSNKRLSPWIIEAIKHAMQSHPAERPQSVEVWKQTLTTIIEGQTTPLSEAQPIIIDDEDGRTIPLPDSEPVIHEQSSQPSQTKLPFSSDAPTVAASSNSSVTPTKSWFNLAMGLITIIAVALLAFMISQGNQTGAQPQPTQIDTEAMLIALAATLEARDQQNDAQQNELVVDEIDYEATIVALQVRGTEQAKTETYLATITSTVDTEATIAAAISATMQAQTEANALNIPTATFTPTITPTDTPLLPTVTPTPLVRQPSLNQLAFQTNRDGNEEVYLLYEDGTGLTNITQNTADDTMPAWSPDGTMLAFVSNRDKHAHELYRLDLQSQTVHYLLEDGSYPAWSPDGKQIAFWTLFGGIQVMDNNGDEVVSITTNEFNGGHPTWSPDGQHLIYEAEYGSNRALDLFMVEADGTAERKLTASEVNEFEASWSPDGSQIAFVSAPVEGGHNTIYRMNVDGSNVISLTHMARQPSWSTDGSQIAFATNRDGNWEIYIMDADGRNPINLTNHPADDTYPAWKP